MPLRQRLTKRVVDAAVAPLKGSQYLWDSEVPGFALRVYTGADGVLRRIYCVRFSSRGRDCWITIGHHGTPWRPDARGNPRTLTAELAREEALRFRGVWQSGGNPRALREAGRFAGEAPPRPACPTLEEFSKRYLAEHSDVHKAWRSAKEDRGYLDRHILPALGKRRLDDIGPGDLATFQAKLRVPWPQGATKRVSDPRTNYVAIGSRLPKGQVGGPGLARTWRSAGCAAEYRIARGDTAGMGTWDRVRGVQRPMRARGAAWLRAALRSVPQLLEVDPPHAFHLAALPSLDGSLVHAAEVRSLDLRQPKPKARPLERGPVDESRQLFHHRGDASTAECGVNKIRVDTAECGAIQYTAEMRCGPECVTWWSR